MPVDMQLQDTTPVVVASASQLEEGNRRYDYTIGVCHLIQNPPSPPTTAVNSISPLGWVSDYLEKKEHKKLNWKSWNVVVLKQANHGDIEGNERGAFGYFPTSEHHGHDNATLAVQVGDVKVKAIYFFKLMSTVGGTDGYDPYEDKENCPNGKVWKISPETSNLESSGVSYSYTFQFTGESNQFTDRTMSWINKNY